MNSEMYIKGSVVEAFLTTILNPKPGSRLAENLHGICHAIIYWEEGIRLTGPAAHQKQVQQVQKYFMDAVVILQKRHSEYRSALGYISSSIPSANTFEKFYDLYEKINTLKK